MSLLIIIDDNLIFKVTSNNKLASPIFSHIYTDRWHLTRNREHSLLFN